MTPANVGSWRSTRSDWKDSWSAHLATLHGQEEDATADRRTTRKARVCLHSQRIGQQSFERTGARSCGGHGGAQEAMDHSSKSQKLRAEVHIPQKPKETERAQAALAACATWRGGRYKEGRGAMGVASLPHVKSPRRMSFPPKNAA